MPDHLTRLVGHEISLSGQGCFDSGRSAEAHVSRAAVSGPTLEPDHLAYEVGQTSEQYCAEAEPGYASVWLAPQSSCIVEATFTCDTGITRGDTWSMRSTLGNPMQAAVQANAACTATSVGHFEQKPGLLKLPAALACTMAYSAHTHLR